jgi:hypothetical protein
MPSATPVTDHDTIRTWAEERGARPARVKGTGGKNDTGLLRLDFPGYSGGDSLQETSWDEWFNEFDRSELALLIYPDNAPKDKRNFNKLVSRDSVREKVER